jgi:SH3-like domain-containing protein
MQGGIKVSIIVSLILIVSIVLAQPKTTQPQPAPPPQPNPPAQPLEKQVPAFPYVAQIIADSVNVRSGPGTNHYDCGKLNNGDTVTVVDSYFSWSRIVPPAGSFSWIHKQYVEIDPANANVAVVTGDSVGVYVGAEARDPIRCTRRQMQLNKGDKVKLLGEFTSDYYKIEPPANAYRWVSTQYTKPLYPAARRPTPPPPPPLPPVAPAPNDTNVPLTAPVVGADALLEQYYNLEKQLRVERAKPPAGQNYEDLKKAFSQIAENKQAGKAARYARFALEQIERCELSLAVSKAVQLQDARLKEVREKIEQARANRLAELQDLGKYAVVGKLRTFTTYGPGHYRLVDDSNRTLCTAVATSSAAGTDVRNYIGRKVGLIGNIEPHPQTRGALVRFTQVVAIK